MIQIIKLLCIFDPKVLYIPPVLAGLIPHLSSSLYGIDIY